MAGLENCNRLIKLARFRNVILNRLDANSVNTSS